MKKKIFVIIVLGILLLCLTACNISFFPGTEEKTDSSIDLNAMDTYMTLRAYGENRKKALDAAKTEIERLDDMWSVGNENSEISRLNKKKKGKVSDETIELITYAQGVSKETDGAFDITIYPLMNLWGFTTKQYQIPDDSKIQQILNTRIGMDKIEVQKTNRKVSLLDGAQIDLGGIAKGFTSQSIAKIFKDYEIHSGIISLGGNIQTIGAKPDGSRWNVGIESPNDAFDMVGVYEAEDEAVITSGGYERYFEKNGKTYHHILDPKTGYPADSDLISVTIVSKNGMRADCLSTALFVLGKEKSIQYWKDHRKEFDFIFVDKKNKILISEGIKNYFKSDYDYEIISQ